MEKVKVRVSVPKEMSQALDKLATKLSFNNSVTRIANAVEYALVRGLPRVNRIYQPPKGAGFAHPTLPVDIVKKLESLETKHQASSIASVGYTALVLGLESLGVEYG